MNIKPLSDRVVLEPISAEEKTKSGIIIPETVEKERPEQGRVIAVGPGKVIPELGKRVPINIKINDIVLFTKYGPNEVKINGKEYLIAREEDILAILE